MGVNGPWCIVMAKVRRATMVLAHFLLALQLCLTGFARPLDPLPGLDRHADATGARSDGQVPQALDWRAAPHGFVGRPTLEPPQRATSQRAAADAGSAGLAATWVGPHPASGAARPVRISTGASTAGRVPPYEANAPPPHAP